MDKYKENLINKELNSINTGDNNLDIFKNETLWPINTDIINLPFITSTEEKEK